MNRLDSISRPIRWRRRAGGFALVVVLLLMVILTVVAVGLLGISSISLRSTDQLRVRSEARANARIALMLALGQLQLEMGPDRRISTPAGILDAAPDTPTFDN